MPRFVVTEHAIIRYVQRTNKKYSHLEKCKNDKCEKCKKLSIDLTYYLAGNLTELNREIREHLKDSKELKAHLADSDYLAHLYNKHNIDEQVRLLSANQIDLLFVVKITSGGQIVTTCFPASENRFGRVAKRTKFKGKGKKIDYMVPEEMIGLVE